MNWLVLTLVSVLIVSFANILQKVLMKDDKSNPYSYAIIFHFLLGAIDLFFAVLIGFQLPKANFDLVYFLLAAIFWGIGTVFLFKALKIIESSEAIILISLRSLVTIAAAVIFLHEGFSILKILGTALILLGIFLVAEFKKGFKFNKGLFYTLATSVFYGLAVVIDAFNIKSYEPVSYIAVVNFLIGLVLLGAYPAAFKQWKNFTSPNFLIKMLPLGFLSSVQAIAFYLALGMGGKISQMGPINQAQVIVTVFLAAFLLKEKDHLYKKTFAASLVIIGVILLS